MRSATTTDSWVVPALIALAFLFAALVTYGGYVLVASCLEYDADVRP